MLVFSYSLVEGFIL